MEKARNSLITAWVAAYPPQEEGRAPSEPGSAGVNVKLPKLDLPKLSWDVLKWVAFWQQFCACVDNQDIPGVTKYNYLVSLLKGDAKSVFEGLPVTESNYEKAKNILCKRYGRKEVIIFTHIKSLLGLEMPASSSDAVELAKYYDKL